MNITLWILQILLALHTAIGAVWKFSNSAEQTAPSLKRIPDGLWKGAAFIEFLCAFALILPLFSELMPQLAPVAAVVIAVEMLLFSGIHISSKKKENSQLIYWLVVAAICAFIAFGRLVLSPF
ncbi:MAG: DoxX family protein [Balneolales bacterium]